MNENLGFFLKLGGLIVLLLIGGGLCIGFMSGRNAGVAHLLRFALQMVFNVILPTGGITIALKLCDQKTPAFEDMICPIRTILFYFVGSLILGAFIFVGLIFFIIPAFYFAARLCLMSFYIVEQGLDPIEALKRSWEATEGRVMELLAVGFILSMINFAGFLALFVGSFVTFPTTMIAMAYLYRVLNQKSPPQLQQAPVSP